MNHTVFNPLGISYSERFKHCFEAPTTPVPVQKIKPQQEDIQALEMIANQIGPIDWSDANLPYTLQTQLKKVHHDIQNIQPSLGQLLEQAKTQYDQHGYCVLNLPTSSSTTSDLLQKELIVSLSTFGIPFGALQRKGLWQTLGVNPEAKELRAESPGYIPLHIDFNQASSPPDGVALFCLRPDPSGGGQNTLFNYESFLSQLSDEDVKHLSEIQYHYSVLYEQNGIGEIYNPHPLIDMSDDRPVLFRYNGKAMTSLDENLAEFFATMEGFFSASSSVVALDTNDLLVMNQRKVLHGRQALGNRYEDQQIPAEQDRFLWQIYLRHDM